jgi:hypothetical protein
MPWFKVEIYGEGLEHAWEALNRAGIPTIGPTIAWVGDPRQVRIGRRMTAVPDAPSDDGAEARVRDNLPDDDDSVESVTPWS